MFFKKAFSLLLWFFLLSLPFQLGRHFWPPSAYLFGLKIDYLSPTLYLQDLLIWLLIYLFVKSISLKVFLEKKRKILIFLLVFSLMNIVFSLSPLTSFYWWARMGEYLLLAVVISRNKEQALSKFQKVLSYLITFEFLLCLCQLLGQSSVGGVFRLFGERSFTYFSPGIAKAGFLGKIFLRPYGTFSHPNSLAGFILICLVFVFNKENKSFFEKISLILGSVLIFLCFSRVIWFLAFLCFLIFFLKTIQEERLSRKSFFSFDYLSLAFFLLFFVFLFTKTEISGPSFVYRVKLAQIAGEIIKTKWLFGVGLGNFTIALARDYNHWDYLYWLQPVHNIFLLVASETGLIGLIIFATFLVLAVKRLLSCYIAILLKKQNNEITRYQDNKITRYSLSLAIALFVVLFSGLFDHYWLTLIQNQLLFVLLFGLVF